MKHVFLFLFAAAVAHAQGFVASINPVAALKALHSRTPVSTKIRRLTMATAVGMNSVDWALTRQYTVPGGGFCEANSHLRDYGQSCYVSVPKLDTAKLVTDLALLSEEGFHQFFQWKAANEDTADGQRKWLLRDSVAERIGIIVNLPVTAIYTGVTIHNAVDLANRK